MSQQPEFLDTDFSDGPLGEPVPGWRPPPVPPREPLEGRLVRLEPLDPDAHAAELYEANAADSAGRIWDYLPYGPFADAAAYRRWVEIQAESRDPMFFAIRPKRDGVAGPAEGVASWLRIAPQAGGVEVGHICYAPALQGTPAATEAMRLMMTRAFALGYRRYEWKCNALNRASRRAAMRLGFSYEGVFRQMMVVKGRNRDTAWYAMIDKEWPAIDAAFERWLAPENFDADGRQKLSLSSLTAPLLVKRG